MDLSSFFVPALAGDTMDVEVRGKGLRKGDESSHTERLEFNDSELNQEPTLNLWQINKFQMAWMDHVTLILKPVNNIQKLLE